MILTDPSIIALASAAFYALALVLAQIGLRYQSALAGAATSLPTTVIVLWVLALTAFQPQQFDWQAFAIFAAAGVLFPVAVTLLSFESNRQLGPNVAGALGNFTPLVAVLFATVILGETLTAGRAVGMLVVVAGVMLLSLRGKVDTRRWPGWALLLPLVAAVIRGLVQPLVKAGLAIWPDPFAATLIGYSVSAAIVLAFAFLRGRRRVPQWSRRGLLLFALVGLCNGAAVLLMYVALADAAVSLVAPLIAVYPLFTLIFSAALLRSEALHLRLLAGIAATVLGVVIVLSG